MPRDIATREIFDICVNEGLSVERGRQCVYLDLTHIDAQELTRKLGGILAIYEKFQGVDPRFTPMKIFPAVHYSMGGLWADYERTAAGGLQLGSPVNQSTNIPNLSAIGECDYQYHGANRLGANSLLSCIFSGLIVAPGIETLFASQYTKVELTQRDGESSVKFEKRKNAAYDSSFVGAHALSQAVLFNSHPTGKNIAGERLDALMDEGGVQVCGNAQNCVAVCPKEIPLTTSIAKIGRQTTVHAIKKWFDR